MHELLLERREERFRNGVIPAVAAGSHGAGDASVARRLAEGERDILGGFNWSSHRLNGGGCDGQASGLDEGADGPVADEVAGQAVASARCRARVLAADRAGLEQRRRRAGRGGVDGGWRPVVSGAWRDADVPAGPGFVPVSVL